MIGELFRKLQYYFRRGQFERELDEEMEHHRAMSGTKQFGNVTLLKEQSRAMWGWAFWEQLAQDLRYAVRTMAANKAFTAVAVLSLALGIGANTAIFSFMDALLMRLLPVSDPRSLVVVNWRMSGSKNRDESVIHSVSGQINDGPDHSVLSSIFPYPAFGALSAQNSSFSSLFAYRPARKLNVLMNGVAEVSNGVYVSGNFFSGLGVVPEVGRLVIADDDRAGAPGVVVLSYGSALRRFGDASRAPGQRITINNVPFTVIGVAPDGFTGVDPAKVPDLYLPLHADLAINPKDGPFRNPEGRYSDDHYWWIEMMGRLRPGVTAAQAKAELGPMFERWVTATAANDKERKNLPELTLANGAGGLDNLRRDYERPLFILQLMVGLILAIACANIANLLLARATARRREIAVRLSIGAGRWRVIRQLLTESLLLASIGGAAGIAFAVWGAQALLLLLADGGSFPMRPDFNWHVLAEATVLAMLTGLAFGLAPAMQATRVDVMPVLKESRTSEGSQRRGRFSLRQALVVSEVALSLLLVCAAGLFVRTLSNLRSIETGFERAKVLTFTLNAHQAGHREPGILSFYSDLQDRFAAIPGVQRAAMSNSPLIGDGAWGWAVMPVGKAKPENVATGHGSGFDKSSTHVMSIGPGFLSAMHIPLLAGREFDTRDRVGSAPVAIVNEAWLKANFDGRNPVGTHVTNYLPQRDPVDMEIVGVAKNARYNDLTGEFPAVVYIAFDQNLGVSVTDATYFLRSSSDPLALASAVREIVRQADARIPITNLGTQEARIDREIAPQIMFAELCTGFAALALAIACVGIFGTMSYAVALRTGEIGIRMALGAQRGTVVWMVLRDLLTLVAVGLVVSIPMVLGMGKLVADFLYGVKPADPQALASAIAILSVAALLATYGPARRASKIDPVVALRNE